jgi:hypothetical protein
MLVIAIKHFLAICRWTGALAASVDRRFDQRHLTFDPGRFSAGRPAIMPGATEALSGVVSVCAGKLAI